MKNMKKINFVLHLFSSFHNSHKKPCIQILLAYALKEMKIFVKLSFSPKRFVENIF